MSALAARSRPQGALRTLGMLLALALGGVAVYLVVVGHTQKQVQIGLLVGFWGLLLGAFSLFGPRRAEADESEVQHARGERAMVRRGEQEQQLAVMVRRETERVLREELSQLRNEVSGLRNDLVEKVNGQLRLERIETTRVISSDIEELQHEVRRLAVASRSAQQAINSPGFASGTVVETEVRTSAPLPYVLAGSPVPAGPPVSAAPPLAGPPPAPPGSVARPASASPAPYPAPGMMTQQPVAPMQGRPVAPPMPAAAGPARSLPPQVPPPVPRPVAPPAPPASMPPPVPRPAAPAPPRSSVPPQAPAATSFPPPEHATSVFPRQQPPPQPRPVSPHPASGRLVEPVDPLQALPRLTRFEYDLEAPPERPSPAWDVTHVEASTQLRSSSPAPESYTGRRRSPGDITPPSPNGTNGHNGGPRGNGSANGTAQPSGRRRRRGDSAGDDVLGRLLGR